MEQKQWWWLPPLIWTQLVVGSAWWSIVAVERQTEAFAMQRGRDLFTVIELTRAWNAKHSGIYAVRSEYAQPNPYLHTPNRDLTTTQGLELTMINPAYMSRQISELARSQNFHFHLTSNNPLRPGNTPDAWEQKALQAFEGGARERLELVSAESGSVYRYMAPLETKPVCLGCHAAQGYQVGDIRGGISFDIDASELLAYRHSRIVNAVAAHTLIWLAVSLSLVLHLRGLRRRFVALEQNREIQAQAIAQKDMALEQASERIDKLERLDSLTGFLNRAFFDKGLGEALDQAEARRRPYGLLMIELDHFQEFNDAYGLLEGDVVLRMAAELIGKRVPHERCLLGRHIGSSFAVGIADIESRALAAIGESIREGIYELGVRHEHSPTAKFVTVTIGAAMSGPTQSLAAEALLKKAAVAMFRAKQQGRNRVAGP